MVLRQVGVMVLVGGVIGLAAAIASAGSRSRCSSAPGSDPVVLAAAAVSLSLVALAATASSPPTARRRWIR